MLTYQFLTRKWTHSSNLHKSILITVLPHTHTHTNMLLSPSSINLVRCKLGKVTIALALYWPCVTDNGCISTYGLTALGRDDSTPPMLLWSMAIFAVLAQAQLLPVTQKTVLENLCFKFSLFVWVSYSQSLSLYLSLSPFLALPLSLCLSLPLPLPSLCLCVFLFNPLMPLVIRLGPPLSS